MNDCRTVLLVDDDKLILRALSRILADSGIELLSAESVAEALALCRTHEVAVLISDHRMPGGSGLVLLKQIKEDSPATLRVLMTGDAGTPEVGAAIAEGLIDTLLLKPWRYDEVIATVNHGLDRYQTGRDTAPADRP
jgi:DNA-binding NtrC family response regulator